MSTGTVTVRGSAVVAGEPDEAFLTMTLQTVRSTQAEAMSEVAERSGDLEGLLDELQVEHSARRTAGVSVRAETEYDGASKKYIHRGYRASNSVTLRLQDPELIGRVMTQAAAGVGAEVAGPYWRIALSNPAHIEAYEAAARDAKRKAQAFATALESRLGTVVRVTEPGTRSVDEEQVKYMRMDVDASYSAEPNIEIHSGTLDVSGEVEVTFNLEEL